MSVQRHLRVVPSATEAVEGLQIAFASSDRKHVDQHFGSAAGFVIYRVDGAGAQLMGVGQFEERAQDGNEAKLVDKFALLDGCDAVYCEAVGYSAVQQLLGRGIQPIKVREATPIADLLADLQQELTAAEPPPWLARVLRRRAAERDDRFSAMAEEGWEE